MCIRVRLTVTIDKNIFTSKSTKSQQLCEQVCMALQLPVFLYMHVPMLQYGKPAHGVGVDMWVRMLLGLECIYKRVLLYKHWKYVVTRTLTFAVIVCYNMYPIVCQVSGV